MDREDMLMRLFTFQKADIQSSRNDDDSVLRICRLAFWRWWKIWGKWIKPPQAPQKQVHSEAAEIDYMSRHPEIWPTGEDHSEVYAEHSYEKVENIEHWRLTRGH